MLLNLVICIINRDKQIKMEKLYDELGLKLRCSLFANGTALQKHLLSHNLAASAKSMICAVVNPSQTKELFKLSKRKMNIDIPGNGILMAIPLKSIGGGKTLAYLTENAAPESGNVEMKFSHEFIVVIMNEGYSDQVMAEARKAGAGGGTVLHARGTGTELAKKFFGVTLTNEKDMLCIVSDSKKKKEIMQAIAKTSGTNTKAGAICFSLPISSVVGLRNMEEDDSLTQW